VARGQRARASGLTLQSYDVGATPLIHHALERMPLERLLQEYLPEEDIPCEFPAH
jgi:hypothetical protein